MNSELKTIERLFQKMKADGFDTSQQLRWGFFFIDSNEENLQKVYNEMREKEYVLESITRTEDSLFQLCVSKIDILAPLKLHKRNLAFNELADYCNVKLYDAWDVEKV